MFNFPFLTSLVALNDMKGRRIVLMDVRNTNGGNYASLG